MGATSRPVKILDANGNLQRLTDSEELYLAYQLGNQLSKMSVTDPSALTTTSSGNTLIGSFTDTVYDQAVGTKGEVGTTITESTTTTSLYQKTGTASETGTDWRTLVSVDADGTIREMADSDFNVLTDKLVRRVMLDEYPGTYRLGSSSPGATYDTHLSSVFSNTLSSGATINYNVYQRQSLTSPPSVVRPIFLKRSSGDEGSFTGVQTYTDSQLSYSLGQRAKTRIMSSSNYVGAYQLRSSAEGAPVDSGTWVARGTATDTQRTLSSGEDYATDFTTDYASVATETFVSSEIEPFTGNFVGEYLGDFTGNYTGDFGGNFTGNFEGTYTGNFVQTDFAGQTSYEQTTFTSSAATNFLGLNFIGDTTYTENDFVGSTDFIGTNFAGAIVNYLGADTFTSNKQANFEGTDYQSEFVLSQLYIGNSYYLGNYEGPAYTGDAGITYTGNFSFDYVGGGTNYQGGNVYQGLEYYLGSPDTNYTGEFLGEYGSGYVGDFLNENAIAYAEDDFIGPSTVFTLGPIAYTGPGVDYLGAPATTVYADDTDTPFTSIVTTNSAGNVDYTGGPADSEIYTGPAVDYISSQIEDFTSVASENYTSIAEEVYSSTASEDYTSIANETFTGNFDGAFTGNFTFDYATDFTSQEILSGTQTIETYTLYCRVA